MSSVSVPVMDDDIVEGKETFTVTMSIPSSVYKGIIAGNRDSATVFITDSTGEWYNIVTSLNGNYNFMCI